MKTKIPRCQGNRPVLGKPCKNKLEDSPAWFHGKQICRECASSLKWDTWWRNGKMERTRLHNLQKKKYKVTDAMVEKTSSHPLSVQNTPITPRRTSQ